MSTPMQKQYNKLKKQYEDCIVLFRLGDFYEAFDNDAKIIAKVLGITLTGRGKGSNRRPMAGIPHHALDNYLPKLVKAGYKVAVAEQLEEPQKGKKIVERDVVKVITAGTITSEKSLESEKNNYIASVYIPKDTEKEPIGLAVCDVTTGELFISEFADESSLFTEVRRISPSELLIDESVENDETHKLNDITTIQKLDSLEFDYNESAENLKNHFSVKNLKGFGVEKNTSGISAAGALLSYIKETQKTDVSHITKIYYKEVTKYMNLDEHTIQSLELVSPLREDSSHTLLSIIDECKTPMGKRLLYRWILNPLKETKDVKMRLDSVEELLNDSLLLDDLRNCLDEICDVERILGRIGNESANGRDMIALVTSLVKIEKIGKIIKKLKEGHLKDTKDVTYKNKTVSKVIKLIESAISDDPPDVITEGEIFKDGYDKKLDDLRAMYRGGKEWIKNLEKEEKERTEIHSLKVKFNKVFGYYIEVSKANLDKVPSDYVRKQTLVNAERFVTPELKKKEDEVLNAEEKAMELEYNLFLKFRSDLTQFIDNLQEVASSIAKLDCLSNFACIARENDYVMPDVKKDGAKTLEIEEGRHPVVEEISDEPFIPNDLKTDIKKQQIAIITGPNMSGKSTYIRQVALIVLMAQIGSFVPAKSLKLSPVDRIFTRVGASDNLAKGESTFLIEMNEAANILNNATKNSLIILDEVGRGTSTYDGVAIAWAVTEYIHEKIGARTLFATHYHELVDMPKYLNRIYNLNVAVKETEDRIIFLRKIKKGGTDESYGVYVAELAGIPPEVINKAKEILLSLEQEGMFEVKHVESELTNEEEPTQFQLGLKIPEHPAINELKKIDVEKMTPLEALKKLDNLQRKCK